MRKWVFEFLSKSEHRGYKIALVYSIRIKKSINWLKFCMVFGYSVTEGDFLCTVHLLRQSAQSIYLCTVHLFLCTVSVCNVIVIVYVCNLSYGKLRWYTERITHFVYGPNCVSFFCAPNCINSPPKFIPKSIQLHFIFLQTRARDLAENYYKRFHYHSDLANPSSNF